MRRISIWLIILLLACSQKLANAQLLSHVTVSITSSTWSYRVFNDEPVDNSNYITEYSMAVNAPFTVTGTPVGWTVDTDNATFVDWFNTDPALPYIHDIAPGSSLGGFNLQSSALLSVLQNSSITAWDHTFDSPGATAQPRVLSPTLSPASTPEPSVLGLLTGLGLACGIVIRRRCTYSARSS